MKKGDVAQKSFSHILVLINSEYIDLIPKFYHSNINIILQSCERSSRYRCTHWESVKPPNV